MRKWTLVSLLVLLGLLIAPVSVFAGPPQQGETEYTVQLDDNLWNIAEKYLGTGAAYRAILLATNIKSNEDDTFAYIKDKSLIYPGQKLLVPDADTATEMLTMLSNFKVGMVSDVGGVDDASFNENTWKGLTDAQEQFGIQVAFIESQAQADYEANITEFAEQGYDMVISVGFLLGDATGKMAAVYPDTMMAIVDYAYDPGIANVQGIVFNVDEAAFQVGYVAAAMADIADPADPKVAYVGGMQIPPVEQFIYAYEAGANYYNEKYGKSVGFFGVYVGNFEATDQGKAQGNSLIDEGADIILGVGGKTGNGGIAAAKERGKWGIGVDVDQYYTLPNEKDILVTSTVKRMDAAVLGVIAGALEGNFGGGGVYVATLANNGVGIAPFHDFEGRVPANIVEDLKAIRAGIINGTIDTGWPVAQ
ncbi:MAG: BMP family ABC transporter substrate-binding protein [Chloroflexota bacterium]